VQTGGKKAGNSMSLSDDQIRRLARLARIAIRPEESAALAGRLNRVLALVDEMRAVDTTGIEPMSHALDLVQRLRPDEVTEGDRRHEYQSVAPAVGEGLYLVPKVIE
jgi:aspartyl-tRNA(Asn)/glutamyl-tRNA(Gln) amidotransferase subunit C